MEQFEGKVAVVTGAASGIGLGLARRFADEGMKVVLADIDESGLATATADLEAGGSEVLAVPTDVSSGEQIEGLAAAALARFGTVHVVCNNAGVGIGGQLDTLSVKDWEWALGVNLWSVIHGMRVFLPILRAQDEGHIVNTASAAGLFAAPYMGPYNATKSAVVAITETAFHELALSGSSVGVSALCPSWVRTNIHDSERARPDHLRDRAPEDAADAPMREVVKNFIESGMEPAEVAGRVVDAIRDQRCYVLTHESSRPAIEARARAILEGGAPPLLMP